MKRATRDQLVAELERLHAYIAESPDKAAEMGEGARDDTARRLIGYGALQARCEIAAAELRATIDVYLRGKR
jgi:hypothetical protein